MMNGGENGMFGSGNNMYGGMNIFWWIFLIILAIGVIAYIFKSNGRK